MPTLLDALQGVPNAHQPLPSLATGGQPSAAHLEAFHRAGGAVVLDIRDSMEPRPFDEPATVRKLGMDYVNVPVNAGTMTPQTLEQILAVLREAGDRPVLFHCASGNRVGGALIPHFILDQGMDEDTAVQEAMRIGLRSAELMEWGMDYARKRNGAA